MTKQELTTLLRSVGVNENTITAMENAYDLGVEFGREVFAQACDDLVVPTDYSIADKSVWDVATMDCANEIRTMEVNT